MDFNRGFDDGYQQALRNHMKIGITPLAPLPPLSSDGSYQSGFAAGAAQAETDIACGKL